MEYSRKICGALREVEDRVLVDDGVFCIEHIIGICTAISIIIIICTQHTRVKRYFKYYHPISCIYPSHNYRRYLPTYCREYCAINDNLIRFDCDTREHSPSNNVTTRPLQMLFYPARRVQLRIIM